MTPPGWIPALQAYQADFADHVSRGDAGDAFVRGNLAGRRSAFRRVPYMTVTLWNGRPALSPGFRPLTMLLVGPWPASSPEEGGWVYLTQDMISGEARLKRQSVNRPLQDLVAAGRVERREMTTHQGHRGHAYRLTGEDSRVATNEPRVFLDGLRWTLSRRSWRNSLLRKPCRRWWSCCPLTANLPDSVLTLLEGINSRREDKSDFLRRLERNF